MAGGPGLGSGRVVRDTRRSVEQKALPGRGVGERRVSSEEETVNRKYQKVAWTEHMREGPRGLSTDI